MFLFDWNCEKINSVCYQSLSQYVITKLIANLYNSCHIFIIFSLTKNLGNLPFLGYGDSSPVAPSEEGVVRDSKAIYEWIKRRSKNTKIFFWGHSLGTGYVQFKISSCLPK